MELLDREYFDNTVRQYLYAAGTAVAIVAGVWLLRTGLIRRARKLVDRTDTSLDDLFLAVLGQTRMSLVLVLSVCAGAFMLELPPRVVRLVVPVATVAFFFQAGIWTTGAIRFIVDRQRAARRAAGELDTLSAVTVLGVVSRGVVWVLVLLLVLDNFGVDVTALVTGLGIGGVAVALAVQTILSDLFASLSIMLDKPFQVGDFIIVGDFMGTVERIGIKTTRVRSLGGEQLVFANNDLVNARLRNYQHMAERRVVFSLGVVYETRAEQVAAIPGLIREAIEEQERARFDRAHFKGYGESALELEAVYYVTSPDYNLYMDVHEAINLSIMRRFQARGIEFAFPSRTLYMRPPVDTGADPERASA